MSGSLFGTDGVRGIPGEGPLKPEAVRALAYHAAKVLLERQGVKLAIELVREHGWCEK